MSEEWGPWIEHDGKGCPVPRGTLGEGELRCGLVEFFRANCGSTIGGPNVRPSMEGSAWIWGSSGYPSHEVIRYRIRKPRGLTLLQQIARDAKCPQKVDA